MTMTNNNKIYISFLPLLIVILLVLGAGYMLLVDEIKLPKFNKGPQIRRIEGFPTTVYVAEDRLYEKQRLVLENESELNLFLNQLDPSGMLTMRDEINFDREYVIAVASEVEVEDNHRVKVKKVYEDKDDKTLLVSIEEVFPGETCLIENSPHIGVDIVAINKTDWNIEFERVKVTEECEDEESTSSEE